MKEFISGLEEAVARMASLVTTLLISIAYTLGNPFNQPKWQEIALFLVGFWFTYEVISYILFTLFKFFSTKKAESEKPTIEIEQDSDTLTDETPKNIIN